MTDQKLDLRIQPGKTDVTGSTVAQLEGERFQDNDLETLGIEIGTPHLRIVFDNDKTTSYTFCQTFIISLVSCLFPFWLLFPCCIYYGVKTASESRKSAVTDKIVVLRSGYYSCCCMCWNEATKSVSLDKITDLSISQSCIESCFNVKTIKVENASSAPGMPEFLLTGVIEPEKVRKMILAVRDGSSDGGGNGAYNMSSLNNNISANNVALANLAKERNDALNEIKDILVDVSKSLKTLNTNVNRTEGLLGNNY